MGSARLAEPARLASISVTGSDSPSTNSRRSVRPSSAVVFGSASAICTVASADMLPSTTSIPRKPKRAVASIWSAVSAKVAVAEVSLMKNQSSGFAPAKTFLRSMPNVRSSARPASMPAGVLKSRSASPSSRSKPRSSWSPAANDSSNSTWKVSSPVLGSYFRKSWVSARSMMKFLPRSISDEASAVAIPWAVSKVGRWLMPSRV